MKPLTLLLGILCLAISSSLFAQSADEAAIKEVCYQEQMARSQKNFDATQSYWQHVDQASLLAPNFNVNLQGWAAIEESFKTNFANNPEPDYGQISQYDHIIHIEGNRAFVQYKEDVVFSTSVQGEPFTIKYAEIRRMSKVDGQWKIINMISAFNTGEMRPADAVVQLRSAALALSAQDRIEEAAQVGLLMSQFFPGHPLGYVVMGEAAMKQKDKAKALQNFEKAATLIEDESHRWIQNMIEAAKKLE